MGGGYTAGEIISVDTINAAIEIGKYFEEHTIAAFRLMQEDAKFEAAKKILAFLIVKRPGTFKGRDILSSLRQFKDMFEVNAGLRVLLERDYIAVRKSTEKTSKKGRPEVTAYDVNPRL